MICNIKRCQTPHPNIHNPTQGLLLILEKVHNMLTVGDHTHPSTPSKAKQNKNGFHTHTGAFPSKFQTLGFLSDIYFLLYLCKHCFSKISHKHPRKHYQDFLTSVEPVKKAIPPSHVQTEQLISPLRSCTLMALEAAENKRPWVWCTMMFMQKIPYLR